MTRLDGNTTPDLAKQQSCSSQDQCSIRLTHISQQTQQSEKQGFAGSGAALAEGSKLLLASVHNKCAQQTSLTKAGLQGGQAAHVTGMAPADSQQLKQRLRSALAAASTALAPEESAAAATTSAAADKVARFSRAEASDNLRAAKKATAACQAAAVTSEAKLLHLAGPQQPAMMATATQTSNSPDRSDTPETASSAADLKDAKEQKPCNAANKATQTQPEKVAMLAVGTQTHDVVPIAAAKQSPISKSHTQPQAELDAAQTLSQLAAGATASQSPNQCSPFATTRLNSPRSTAAGPQSSKHHNSDASTRQVSPITVPRLSSPKRTPTAKTVPSLPHVTPHRSRQSCLSPDARDKTAGVESPRAQHVNSSQVIHASPSKAKSSMRTFRGRGVQPAAHDDSDDHLAATPIQQQRSHKDSNTGKGIALPRTPETVCNAPLVASSPAAEVKPLLADIMGTTGCRVTRRLVHSVLAAATAPTKPSSKERSAAPAPRSATAFRVAAAPLAKKHGRPPRKPSQLQSDEVCNQETDLRTPTYSTDSMQQTACKAQNSNSAKLHEVTHPAGLQALGGMIQKHPPSTALLAAETPTAAASGGMASNCVGGLVAPDNIACLADSPSQQGVHQTTPHAAANDRHLATPNTSERHSRREQHAGASERPDLKRDLADAAERPELPKKPKVSMRTCKPLYLLIVIEFCPNPIWWLTHVLYTYPAACLVCV